MVINIHGRNYPVPASIAPEPKLAHLFDTLIRNQLQGAAAQRGIPKAEVTLNCFRDDGEYELDERGEVKTRVERHWLDFPDELHEAVKVPTAEDVLAAAKPAPTPAAPAVAVPDQE